MYNDGKLTDNELLLTSQITKSSVV